MSMMCLTWLSDFLLQPNIECTSVTNNRVGLLGAGQVLIHITWDLFMHRPLYEQQYQVWNVHFLWAEVQLILRSPAEPRALISYQSVYQLTQVKCIAVLILFSCLPHWWHCVGWCVELREPSAVRQRVRWMLQKRVFSHRWLPQVTCRCGRR